MPQRSHRAAIVDNAEVLLRRKGLVAASVADICKAAGVPKGSFYSHFESKDALVAEIVRRFCASIDPSILHGAEPAPQRLRKHFAAAAARLESDGAFGCLIGAAAGEVEATSGGLVRAAVCDGLEGWTKVVEATVAEGQQAGQITADQPAREIAAFLIDTFEGAALLAKATVDHSAPLRHVELALGILSR